MRGGFDLPADQPSVVDAYRSRNGTQRRPTEALVRRLSRPQRRAQEQQRSRQRSLGDKAEVWWRRSR